MNVMASATISGKRTNRVRVKRRAASAGTAKARYRKDPSTRALDTVQVCVSMPVADLLALDAVCERVQMARSHFVRQACKHFAAQVLR